MATRKVKKFADGGLSGIAETANSLMGEVDTIADRLKTGTGGGSSLGSQPYMLHDLPNPNYTPSKIGSGGLAGALPYKGASNFKKGGAVKTPKSSSVRGVGKAQRGVRKCKMV